MMGIVGNQLYCAVGCCYHHYCVVLLRLGRYNDDYPVGFLPDNDTWAIIASSTGKTLMILLTTVKPLNSSVIVRPN